MRKYSGFEEMLRDVCSRYPDHTAIISAVRDKVMRVTYKELMAAVDMKVQTMRNQPEECFGLCGKVTPSWILHALSAAIAGKRVVMVDSALSVQETGHVIKETGIDFFYCDNLMKARLLNPKVAENRRAAKKRQASGRHEIECGGELIFYSSGTAGESRPCVLTQRALMERAWSGGSRIPLEASDVGLDMIPLSHVFGFVCSLLWPLSYGAAVAVGRGLNFMAKDTKFFHPSFMCLVPAQLKYLLAKDALNQDLKFVVVGADTAPRELFDAARARGVEVYYGYGLTETGSGLAMSAKGKNPLALEVCPGTEVVISREDEILVRCDGMMKGYYHRAEETGKKLEGGYFHTGDMGYLDEEGNLHVEGRAHDILELPDGRELNCLEAERELARVCDTQVALTVRDRMLILVVIAEAPLMPEIVENVRRYNRKNSEHLLIGKVVQRDEPFPRTANGKLKRYLL